MATPYTRGSTFPKRSGSIQSWGYPVHAGIDLTPFQFFSGSARLPRTRGDRPASKHERDTAIRATPYTRGSTPKRESQHGTVQGYPVHAGIDLTRRRDYHPYIGLPRTRGDRPNTYQELDAKGKATPYTRGSTPAETAQSESQDGYPVHAGIDPYTAGSRPGKDRLPRTRGDRPHSL